MSFLTNSGNSGVYPAVLHIYQYLLKYNLCKTYVRTLYLCIVSLLPIFKCMASFCTVPLLLILKCMAPLYYRANLLTIPTSIGYTLVYGILGNKI